MPYGVISIIVFMRNYPLALIVLLIVGNNLILIGLIRLVSVIVSFSTTSDTSENNIKNDQKSNEGNNTRNDSDGSGLSLRLTIIICC